MKPQPTTDEAEERKGERKCNFPPEQCAFTDIEGGRRIAPKEKK